MFPSLTSCHFTAKLRSGFHPRQNVRICHSLHASSCQVSVQTIELLWFQPWLNSQMLLHARLTELLTSHLSPTTGIFTPKLSLGAWEPSDFLTSCSKAGAAASPAVGVTESPNQKISSCKLLSPAQEEPTVLEPELRRLQAKKHQARCYSCAEKLPNPKNGAEGTTLPSPRRG